MSSPQPKPDPLTFTPLKQCNGQEIFSQSQPPLNPNPSLEKRDTFKIIYNQMKKQNKTKNGNDPSGRNSWTSRVLEHSPGDSPENYQTTYFVDGQVLYVRKISTYKSFEDKHSRSTLHGKIHKKCLGHIVISDGDLRNFSFLL